MIRYYSISGSADDFVLTRLEQEPTAEEIRLADEGIHHIIKVYVDKRAAVMVTSFGEGALDHEEFFRQFPETLQ